MWPTTNVFFCFVFLIFFLKKHLCSLHREQILHTGLCAPDGGHENKIYFILKRSHFFRLSQQRRWSPEKRRAVNPVRASSGFDPTLLERSGVTHTYGL